VNENVALVEQRRRITLRGADSPKESWIHDDRGSGAGVGDWRQYCNV